MKVDFIDLNRIHAAYMDELASAVDDVVRSGHYIGGPRLASFQRQLAEYICVADVIGVSSGTDALLATLMALGIGPGDEVVVPALTFVSPASCVMRLGATPVFVDVDEAYGLDPSVLEGALGHSTKAIIAVHLFGQCVSSKVFDIAHAWGIPVVEDAAQAIGATLNGQHAGTMGVAGCFSFFPTKTLGALGDGGAVITRDDALAQSVRLICRHGARPKYHHIALGGNFRLDALQAAALEVKLRHLDGAIQQRQSNADLYRKHLNAELPIVRSGANHTYHQFCVQVDDRDAIRQSLASAGVQTMVYYPESLPSMPLFGGGQRDFPATQQAADRIVALPIHEGLTEAELDYVVETWNRVVG